MREAKRCYELLSHLTQGKVLHWNSLKQYSNSTGRDVKWLLNEGLLRKVGPGLYLLPEKSRFGNLPPDEHELVSAFLKSNDFLMFSPNLYNELGLGLTQLKNETIVYNKKRHETVELSGRLFQFRRPNNGYPKELTVEFLLVDLMNNIDDVGEDPDEIKKRLVRQIKSEKYDKDLLLNTAQKHRKIATRKYFSELCS